jgi:transposase
MDVLYPRSCGLDVHKKTVTACVVTPDSRETRTFGTVTAELLKLREWLSECEVTHVAMESTGVFWKPIYNLLEDSFSLLLVNAQHVKALPGRKTDVKDAEWIADLLRHGLVRGSFVPDRKQREVRELARYRRTLIEERAREVNRIQKVLEGANIKLSSVASDIVGVSGKMMLQAMISGVEDPRALAEMAKGTLRRKKASLEEALQGVVSEEQKTLLKIQIDHLDFLDKQIAQLDAEINNRMQPLEDAIERLDTIPGMDRRSAEDVLAEIGTDMGRFPTSANLSSWAGLCPGNNQSGGKRNNGRTRNGNRWLCSALVRSARAATRRSTNYLSALYHRIVRRRGDKRAILAVAHSIIVIIHNMLRSGTTYQDLGYLYFDRRDQEHTVRRAVQRLEKLGYKVSLQVASTSVFSE